MERKPKFEKGQKVQMVLNKYDNPIHAHHVGEVFVVKEVMEEYHDNDKTNIVFSYNIQNDDEVGLLCEEGELKAIEDKPIDMVNSPKHYCDLIEDYECIVQDYVSDSHRDDPQWDIKDLPKCTRMIYEELCKEENKK